MGARTPSAQLYRANMEINGIFGRLTEPGEEVTKCRAKARPHP
jgi:hypothetical protein